MTGCVALTGATGFIGTHLRSAFLDRGWQVRALARRPPANEPRVEWLAGDLHDADALARLVDGAGVVVHCAGRVRGSAAAQFNHANAQGTRQLVRAAAAQRPWPRFLLMSSLAARQPELSWYAASKRLAEEFMVRHADAMPWAALRPTAVYGPGDRELTPLFECMQRGLLPVLGPLRGRISLLHVQDLVEAVLCWAQSARPVRGVFEIHDGSPEGYSWRELMTLAEEIWGRPVRRLPIHRGLLRGVGAVNLGLAWLAGYDPMLTPGKVRELRHPDWRCDNGPFSAAVGWSPRVTLSAALRRNILVPA